jgi:hypothetical protein
MQQLQEFRSLQRELDDLDVVNEIYLDADNDRLLVKFRSGFDFRLDQVLRDYEGIEFTAKKEGENQTKSYIGLKPEE